MITRKDNIVERKIHDTCFLIDIREKYENDKCHLYELNETGDYIWNHLDAACQPEEIAALLTQEFAGEAEYDGIYRDVLEFVGILMREGFLEETDGRDQ